MISKPKFFAVVRNDPMLFGGNIDQSAVVTMEALIDEYHRRKLKNLMYLAYMMSTARGEVGRAMTTVREGFRNSDAESRGFVSRKGYKYAASVNGHVYYGRGLVQLTWFDNYVKMGKLLNLDLANNPDLALEPSIAVQIMFEGMLKAESGIGDFTHKSLEMYFDKPADKVTNTDWREARRIINGTDRAEEFGEMGRRFYRALLAAEDGMEYREPVHVPSPPLAPADAPAQSRPAAGGIGGLIAAIFAAIAKAFSRKS